MSVNRNTEQIYTEQDEEVVTGLRFIIYINAFSFKAELGHTFAFSVNGIPPLRTVLEAFFHLRALLNQN